MSEDELKAIELRMIARRVAANCQDGYAMDDFDVLIAEVRRLRRNERQHEIEAAKRAVEHRMRGKRR